MKIESANSFSEKKELEFVLWKCNASKAFFSAVFLFLGIPVAMLAMRVLNVYGQAGHMMIVFLVACEFTQMLGVSAGYFLMRRNEITRYALYSDMYFVVTVMELLFMARMELVYSGSILFYGVAAVYGCVVTDFYGKKQRLIVIAAAVMGSVLAVFSGAAVRNVVDAVLIMAAMTIFAKIFHDHVYEYEKLNYRYRMKTTNVDTDVLTGLANEKSLLSGATALWSYCTRNQTELGIINIDIDFFKKYNDTYGRKAGDRCLKKVAETIEEIAQDTDNITARMSGAEFVLFVQGLNAKELTGLAMDIRRAISDLAIPQEASTISNCVTVSMGIAAVSPDKGTSFEQLYEMADNALYLAKKNGRNCVVCNNRIYGRMNNNNGILIPV